MKKYTNAEKQEIINQLQAIVDKRVKFWQEDFDQDREIIKAKENALPMIFIARDDEDEDWEFFAGSNYYQREANNTPMSDKQKGSL